MRLVAWDFRPVAVAAFAALTYRAVVRGDLTLDVGVGRRTRSLGCDPVLIDAPRETVFGAVGAWWAGQVAGPWEAAVRSSFAGVKAEAERRGARR